MDRLHTAISVYGNRRMAALAGLGMVSGLPYVLAGDTLGAWLSSAGANVKTIGVFSLIGLPYALKFLWAPLLDRFLPPGLGRLGRRRSWLVVIQAILCLLLAGLAWVGDKPCDHLALLAMLGTALVLFSATQDVVADAYRADVLHRSELGAGAAVFVSAYRVAMILGGAGALVLANRAGWQAAYAAMAGLMGLGVVVTLLAPEPAHSGDRPASLREAMIQPLVQFAHRGWSAAVMLAAFVIIFRLPDSLANRMTMPLLIKHLNFTTEEVGWLRQLLGFVLTIAGALAGGAIMARSGLMRSLIVFGILQTLSNAGFLLLAHLPPNLGLMGLVIGLESFCSGLVAAGFVAFLMSCCDRRYSATQYALLSACMALASALGGATTGFLVERLGYGGFFMLTILVGVPGLLMLPALQRGIIVRQGAHDAELIEAAA